jgi:hypothetical protein
MNHNATFAAEVDQTAEDLLYEVSDETLEAAASPCIGGHAMVIVGPTVIVGRVLLT